MDGWSKESLPMNDRRMDVREASDRARNRNEWRTIVTLLIGICCCHRVAL